MALLAVITGSALLFGNFPKIEPPSIQFPSPAEMRVVIGSPFSVQPIKKVQVYGIIRAGNRELPGDVIGLFGGKEAYQRLLACRRIEITHVTVSYDENIKQGRMQRHQTIILEARDVDRLKKVILDDSRYEWDPGELVGWPNEGDYFELRFVTYDAAPVYRLYVDDGFLGVADGNCFSMVALKSHQLVVLDLLYGSFYDVFIVYEAYVHYLSTH